jgi:hypothetical protein
MLSLAETPTIGVGPSRLPSAALFDTAEGMMGNLEGSIDFKGRVSKLVQYGNLQLRILVA